MKFVSKSSNLCITLKPGIPASSIAGTPMNPGIHIRFEDGMATVNDEELVEKMLNHNGFGSDFVRMEEDQKDPYESNRTEKEPAHNLVEMDYGQPGKSIGTKKKLKLTPQMKEALQEMAKPMAIEMAKEIAPQIAVEIVKNMTADKGDTPVEAVDDVPEPIGENAADDSEKKAPAKEVKSSKKTTTAKKK